MRCPTLKELPPPPGKTGWPWTEESEQLPDTMPDGKPWPRISIVTPNLNYGQFIEETIRSVLLQGYPDLEYIVIDGGSTDNSVKIIKKYEKWLAYWVSELDKGQAHAINKGFEKSRGIIGNWINSDDLFLSPAFYYFVLEYTILSSEKYGLFYGKTLVTDEKLDYILKIDGRPYSIENLKRGCIIPQPSTFFTRAP